jgi:hypothetical protein
MAPSAAGNWTGRTAAPVGVTVLEVDPLPVLVAVAVDVADEVVVFDP